MNPKRIPAPSPFPPAVLFGLPLLTFLSPPCFASPEENQNEQAERQKIRRSIESIRSQQPVLSISSGRTPSPHLNRYLTFYDLDKIPARHHFGYMEIHKNAIAVHTWLQEQPGNGTCVLLHGYYDHTGILAPLIQFLAEHNWNIVTMDLPGHGLSEGKRVTIDSFPSYREVLLDVYRKLQDQIPPPHIFMGHSLGGGILIDGALRNRNHPLKQIILIAPLIQSAYWTISRFGFPFIDFFVDRIDRRPPSSSHDESFLRFLWKEDPLQTKYLPLKWVEALFSWNKNIRNASPDKTSEVTVIQGTNDSVVSGSRNLQFIREKFTSPEIHKIEDGKHHLINESPEYRRQFFQILKDQLGN